MNVSQVSRNRSWLKNWFIGYAFLLIKRKESELLFMQEPVFYGLTTNLQLISLLDIFKAKSKVSFDLPAEYFKAHFIKITFSTLSAFLIFYSINVQPPSKSQMIQMLSLKKAFYLFA